MKQSPPPADAVCALFGLGTPRVAMTAVAGGLTHLTWRLDTERGRFAIKQINRDWGNPDYVAWYERAFAVEMAAFGAGVPMPRPIAVAATGQCLGEIEDDGGQPITLRAHEWADGAVLRLEECGADEARAVGGMLAQIHALRVAPTGEAQYVSAALDPATWRSLVERGAAMEWREQLEALLPVIDDLIALGAEPATGQIMSHRDTDAKNILRAADGRLMIIDWDASGPVVPRQEVAMDAIVWAGGYVQDPDPEHARAFVEGYRAGGGVFESPRAEDFAEFLRNMLGWLAFNLRRTLGERVADDGHRELANRVVRDIVSAMPRYARSLDVWARMLAAA